MQVKIFLQTSVTADEGLEKLERSINDWLAEENADHERITVKQIQQSLAASGVMHQYNAMVTILYESH